MFTGDIKTKEAALCHLFLHCCYKNGEFEEKELDYVSGLFVELGLHTTLNFKEEVVKYKTYKPNLGDDGVYLSYLIKMINPVHEAALYSYCVELCLSDDVLDMPEDIMLTKIAGLLQIDIDKQSFLKTLMTQRKAVELEKIF